MGVYINMEMPSCCGECRFCGEYCYAKGDENKYSHLPCPLVPVPKHGDLIDRDETVKTLAHDYAYAAADMVRDEIPTIIPADGKDTDVSTREEVEG